jgi:hypothetical protein
VGLTMGPQSTSLRCGMFCCLHAASSNGPTAAHDDGAKRTEQTESSALSTRVYFTQIQTETPSTFYLLCPYSILMNHLEAWDFWDVGLLN